MSDELNSTPESSSVRGDAIGFGEVGLEFGRAGVGF